MLVIALSVGSLTLTFLDPAAGARQAVQVLTETPATAANRDAGPAHNSAAIAAHPSDGEFLALAHRRDAPSFGCGLQLSGDGGSGWVPAQPVPTLPPGADTCYAPEVAFDRKGTLHYLFVGLAGRGNRPMGVFLASSSDRGRSFGPPHQVLGPNNFGVRMAIDRSTGSLGRIHLIWLQSAGDPAFGGFGAGPNPIVSAYSDDSGETFSPPVQVSTPQRPRVVGPALALGPDHSVHVAYYDLADDARDYHGLEGPVWDGTWSVVVRSSHDGGATFGPEVTVDDGVRASERIMLVFTMPPPALVAIDDDRLCLAWTDARHGDPDAFLRCSAAGEGGWEALRRLNDDPVGNGRHQYQPRLAVAPDGRIDAVFYDRRLYADNRLTNVAFTYSNDEGRTFAPNVRLNREPSNTLLGPRYAVPSATGQVEFGSRLAVLATPSEALAAWTDTRNGAIGKTSQDIFVGGVAFSSSGDRRTWTLGIAVAAGALGLFVVTVAWKRRRLRARRNWDDGSRLSKAKRRRLSAASLGLVALSGCATGGERPDWPPSPAVVAVTMDEYTFQHSPVVPPGRAVFQVRNAGALEHELQFFALPEDLPPIDAQLRGNQRRSIPVLGGVPHRSPGESGTFAVDLVPGQRYAMICFLSDGGEQHTLKGMSSEFRVAGPIRQQGS